MMNKHTRNFSDIGETTEYLYGTANKNNGKLRFNILVLVCNKSNERSGEIKLNFEGVNSPDREISNIFWWEFSSLHY